jgi:hypothetical protein
LARGRPTSPACNTVKPGDGLLKQPMAQIIKSFLVLFFKKEPLARI